LILNLHVIGKLLLTWFKTEHNGVFNSWCVRQAMK
jgi:hypothetical protein